MGDDYRSLSRYWRRGAAELLHGRKGRGRAWIGGLFELVDGCQGPWFSLEVTRGLGPLSFR